MRYDEGPTTQADTVIDAPVERIWELVTDISLPARFSSELQHADWLDPGPAVGARFRGRNRHAAIGEWETTSVVTGYEEGRVFAWAVGDAEHPSASWRFTLTPVDGGIGLELWMRIGPAPSGLTPAIVAMPDKEERIIARRLAEHRANMQATVDGIKQLAEATA